AQIGAPGFSSGAMTLRQLLAILVGTIEAAEIGALAGPYADDKERHVRRLRQLWRRLLRRLLLCLDGESHAEGGERQCGDDGGLGLVHCSHSLLRFSDALRIRVNGSDIGLRGPPLADAHVRIAPKPDIVWDSVWTAYRSSLS